MKLKLFYSLKRKVLAVCLAGMILMALCVGGISLWTISHLTYDYEIQNMNHLVDTKATIINDELLRSESIVNYAANSVSRKISDPDQLRNPAFQQRLAQSVDHDFQDATTNLHIICSYYLYYPSENISALWKASRGHDSMFYDVLAQQRGESGQAAPRHVVAFAYLMDQGKAAWTQPYYSPYLNRYIISYLRPIYEDGVMVAIIGVDLDFQAFIDRLYAKPSEGEEHGMIILSDATGTVEYSPKKPLGVPLADKDIHLVDTSDKVAEASQTDNTMVTYTWDGQQSIAGIKGLRNGMNFIDLRQVEQIYDRTHKAFMQMGFGLVAVCILASLLPLYMISRLSERLQLVIEAAKEVGEGNYDVKLHDMHPDDIGELSRNFQAMAEKVAAAQENLTYMSQHDALTGILNRMGLDKEVADWLKAHPASHGALVSLDLDGFKFINDLHGHMAGDEALRTLAKDLIESFGHDQIIGRNGGDEFVVFMKDTEPEQAEKVIKAFSNKVKTFTYDGEIHAFSVSIGYTLYKGDGMTLSRLFHQSDTALYAVKLRGRNHYRAYDGEPQPHLARLQSRDHHEEPAAGAARHGGQGGWQDPVHQQGDARPARLSERHGIHGVHRGEAEPHHLRMRQGARAPVDGTAAARRCGQDVFRDVLYPYGQGPAKTHLLGLAHGGQSQLRARLLCDARGAEVPLAFRIRASV